jgi:CHAT domain-containing protein
MVQAALPEYGVLHFSCHGVVDRNDPLASHLKVAADGNLTLRDVLRLQIPRARLAVLSACETTLAGADLPEEVISLPSGFLQAGAAGVLGSLWPVGDSATCALMVRFYELWQGAGIDPAEALRQAQRWLRDTCASDEEISYGETVRDGHKPHVHPTHWAAFAFTGV